MPWILEVISSSVASILSCFGKPRSKHKPVESALGLLLDFRFNLLEVLSNFLWAREAGLSR